MPRFVIAPHAAPRKKPAACRGKPSQRRRLKECFVGCVTRYFCAVRAGAAAGFAAAGLPAA
ncbi:hypothetical protein, partial [Burkholderia cenocepacia]